MENFLQKQSDVEFDLLAHVDLIQGVFHLLQNKIMVGDSYIYINDLWFI